MSEPVLNPEEVADLLEEVSTDEINDALFSSLPDIPQPENAEVYEFGSKDDGPDRYPLFKGVQERTLKDWREAWSDLFKKEVEMSELETSYKIYGEEIAGRDRTVFFSFECENLGRMMVCVDIPVIISCVDSMLGGDGEIDLEDVELLSPVEQKLSIRISNQIEGFLEGSWAPIEKLDFKVHKIDTDPQFLSVAAASEKMFGMSGTIKLNSMVSGKIDVFYPRTFIEPLLDLLRSSDSTDDSTQDDPEWNDILTKALNTIDLEMVVDLGSTRITIADFLELNSGDEIALNTNESNPLVGKIRGHELYELSIGEKDGQIMGEITKEINGEDNE